MRRLRAGWGSAAVVAAVAWVCLAPAPAPAQSPPCSLEDLAHRSCCELEQLYRQAEAKPTPPGFSRGKPIYCANKSFAGARKAMTGLMWRGKILDACGCGLVNQWLGLKAIKAR